MEKVIFCSEWDFKKIESNKSIAVISITEPIGASHPLIKDDEWAGVLRLKFLDTDDQTSKLKFSEDHSRQIIEFVSRMDKTATSMVVHCYAGISRSAAIAKWIAEHLDLPFNHRYNLYNRHVYSTLDKVGKTWRKLAKDE